MAAKARPQDASAITHRRAAQASRVPRPMTSGSAAPATSSQTMGERAVGPTAKRMTSPQLGAVAPATGRPKMATEPLPASAVPDHPGQRQDQGHPHGLDRHDEDAATSARARPTRTEPSTQATAVTRTMGTTAGANAAATAMTAPRMATWPAGRLRHRGPGSTAKGATPAARARRSAMNGKAA